MVKLLLELICLFIIVLIYLKIKLKKIKKIPDNISVDSGLIVNSFPLLTVVYIICCQKMTHLTVTFANYCIHTCVFVVQ